MPKRARRKEREEISLLGAGAALLEMQPLPTRRTPTGSRRGPASHDSRSHASDQPSGSARRQGQPQRKRTGDGSSRGPRPQRAVRGGTAGASSEGVDSSLDGDDIEDEEDESSTVLDAEGRRRAGGAPASQSGRDRGSADRNLRRNTIGGTSHGNAGERRRQKRRQRAPGPGLLWLIPIAGILILAATIAVAVAVPVPEGGFPVNYVAPIIGGIILVVSVCFGGYMIRRKRQRYFESRIAARDEAKRRIREQVVAEMLRQQREEEQRRRSNGVANGPAPADADAASLRSFEMGADYDVDVEEEPAAEEADIHIDAARLKSRLDEKQQQWMEYLSDEDVEDLQRQQASGQYDDEEEEEGDGAQAAIASAGSVLSHPRIMITDHEADVANQHGDPNKRDTLNSMASSRNAWEAEDYQPNE